MVAELPRVASRLSTSPANYLGSRSWRSVRPSVLALALSGAFAATALAQTVPTGGAAVHGQAHIVQTAPGHMLVTTGNGAGTSHSAINWQSFSLSAGTSVRFDQPSATSLSINRVVTQTPSALFGTLSSNGRLVLVNPSGITVGAGAVVDTAGFTASALRMTDADALAGRLRFGASTPGQDMSGAGLTVDGRITARNGDVVLIAPQIGIGTSALVQSPNGSTILAAGQQVEITGRGLEGISLLVQARENEARNLGRLEGDAVGIFAGTLRHSGEIQATTATLDGGVVVLQAIGDASVEGNGSIRATGKLGGQVDVFGNRVAVTGQALVDVSGSQGGGAIRIGGDFQGKNPAVLNAEKSYLGHDAQLRADATQNGDGGRVIVWADNQTQAFGSISATGGAQGGNGGFVEVSGKQVLAFDARVDMRATWGVPGTLLLDPNFIEVSIGGVANATNVDQFADLPGSTQTIAPATLNAVGGNVTLQATKDINFNDPVSLTTLGASLTALAGGIISVGSSITTNQGDITLYANHPSAGGTGPNGSGVYVSAPLTSNGGNILIRSDGSDVGGNSIYLTGNINAGTGQLTLNAPNDRIQQVAGALTAAILSANADSEIDLNQAGNAISSDVSLTANLATGSSGNQVQFRNSAASFNLNGAVAKGDVILTTSGSMTTDGVIQSGTGNVSITTTGFMSFADDVIAAGNLTLISNNNHIGQSSGGLTVGGISTISAGTGDIALTSMFNDMTNLALTGGDIIVRDATALNITSRAQLANRLLILEAGGALSIPGGGPINTGTAQLSLISGSGPFTTPGALTGSNILLSSQGTLTLANSITASGNLTLTAGGAINQSGGTISAVGATGFGAGVSNVTLAQAGNNFSSIGGTGGLVSITDQNAVVLNATNSNGLTVNASGNITQTAALIIGGTTTVNAGTGNITLATAGNNLNNLNVSGNALNIVEGASSALTVLSLSSGANQPVSLSAGHDLTLPVTAINTGTANLTLSSGHFLTSPGALSGNAISLSAVTGMDLIGEIIASGNFSASTSATPSTVTVRRSVTAGGTMNLALAGDLSVLAGSAFAAAALSAVGDQTISAEGILLQAGNSGPFSPASIAGQANQTITVGSGGLTLVGGSGAFSGNSAHLEHDGGAGTSQLITINGTGFISLQGGSSTVIGGGNGSFATINSDLGNSQTINFTGGGAGRTITLTGGTLGSDNFAEIIYKDVGAQTITGASTISLTGGASGGIVSDAGGNFLGNEATIFSDQGSQSITANAITLQGGAAGINNFAVVGSGGNQVLNIGAGGLSLTGGGGGPSDIKNAALVLHSGDTAGTRQTITMSGGGSISLQGGSSSGTNVGLDANLSFLQNGSTATIRSDGVAQLIEFTGSGSSITMTGGTVGSNNVAVIQAEAGTQTIRGDIAAHAPAINLQGGASGGLGGTANEGNRAAIYAKVGNQDISAASISLTGGASGEDNVAQLRQGDVGFGEGSVQTVSIGAGGLLSMLGGDGGPFNFARIRSHGTAQLIEFTGPGGRIDMTGGSSGTDNHATVFAVNGSQTIRGSTAANAPTISLQGGSGGTDNRAGFAALIGNQVIEAGAGGMGLVGGSGGTSDLRNGASVYHNGPAATSQTITIHGGGDLTLQGGDSAAAGTGFNGSTAYFSTPGALQLIEFSAPGSTLSITGGTVGTLNTAGLYAFNGNQIIRGSGAANAPVITMAGGASGGIAGEGNYSEVTAALGSQTIQAAAISLAGGVAGTDNFAKIDQSGTSGTSQNITIVGGGNIDLQGGAGTTNMARVRSQGDTQVVDFAAAGSLTLTGGTGASLNYARIEAVNGNQTISGAPDITVTGGASGGAAALGNFAQLRARNAGTQSITANTLTIVGGAGGVENDAGIRNDASQTVWLNGAASSNAIVIGSAGSADASYIIGHNQLITAGTGVQSGSITIRGGNHVGKNSGIFNNAGAQTVSTSGSLSITGGSAVGTLSTCEAVTGGACAMVRNGGAGLLTVTTGADALIQGGSAGVANGAGIFVNAGDLTFNVGGTLTLIAGTGTSANFASIGGSGSSGRTQTFNVTGNVTLDASNATDGSSAFIGLAGAGDLGTTVIDINSGGNVTLIGSNVSATTGPAVGVGASQTNATATVMIDAIDIVMNAGSAAGTRIGHSSAANGPGSIALNATANVTLTSNGAIGNSLRTTGNVTVNAGGNFTEGASDGIFAGLLTASAGGSMVLDSALNNVGSLNATLPFFNTGNLLFTNGSTSALTISAMAMAGTNRSAVITSDDINITGAVSNIGGPVILRPRDLARNVVIESTPTGGVLSLSPAELLMVTNASILEIGRLDGTGNLSLTINLPNNSNNVGTLRLLTGQDFFSNSGASIGDFGTAFNHDLQVRAKRDLQINNGNMFLANDRNLLLYADDDGIGGGVVSIGATTLSVGDASNSSGSMDVKGSAINVAVAGNTSASLNVFGAGNQTFTATAGDLRFENNNAGADSGFIQIGAKNGTQSLTASNLMRLQAGGNNANSTSVKGDAGQVINAAQLQVVGGGSGTSNFAQIVGGTQSLTIGAGGIGLNGGGGAGNYALIRQDGAAGSQTISAAGNIQVNAGSGTGGGNWASIDSFGTGGQAINLTAGGTITVTGGGAGFSNRASIIAQNGNQTITGASAVTIAGGAAGGGFNTGNSAQINQSGSGDQSVTVGAGGLLIQGGGGTGNDQDNSAFLGHYGTGTQTVTMTGGGDITVIGGSSAKVGVGGSGHGSRAGIDNGTDPSAQQFIVLDGGDITLTGGTNGSRNYAGILSDFGTQSITGATNISLTGGDSGGFGAEGNRAQFTAAISQTVAATNITLNGGVNGTENFARIGLFGTSALTQTITASSGLILTGGADGGGFSTGNAARIQSDGSQLVTTGAGGITITGGAGSLSDNQAIIYQNGTVGTSQSIQMTGGGSIVLQGGSSAGTNVGGTGHGSFASIEAKGETQLVNFAGGGTLTLTGGSGGSRNRALVYAFNGNQTVSGAAAITLQGGAGGGFDGEGNWALISTQFGSQSITTSGTLAATGGGAGIENTAGLYGAGAQTINANRIALTGGAGGGGFGDGNHAFIRSSASQLINVQSGGIQITGGSGSLTDNDAQIEQRGTTGSQTIIINSGSVTIQGGSSAGTNVGGTGHGSRAQIYSEGTAQNIQFTGTAGTLSLTGGTVGSRNHATIYAENSGSQTISGPSALTLTGGANGGFAGEGNSAYIGARAGAQTITGGATTLSGGAAGIENSTSITALSQSLTVNGDLILSGGGGNGGARIGGGSTGSTSLNLNVFGDLFLNGGTGSGSAIGSSGSGVGLTNAIIVSASGDVTLAPSATQWVRIGSPAADLQDGNVFITAVGNLSLLNGGGSARATILSLGDVTLNANLLSLGGVVLGNTIFAQGDTGVSLSGVGSLTANATAGNSIEVVAASGGFSNTAGSGALNVTSPARWLVYSNDPVNDTRGGLVAGFKQYNKTFGDSTAIAGSGNGFLYSIAPTAVVNLTGIVSKVYDGTDVATLTAGNFLASGGIDGDVVSINGGASGSYDTRHAGTSKTVSVGGVTISALNGTIPVFGYGLAGGTASGPIGTITAAPLTVSTAAINKSYDATTAAPSGIVVVTAGTLASGDTFAGGSFAFVDPNAGTGKTVTVSGVSVNDGNGGANYSVGYADNTLSSISAAAITLSSANVVKAYDGTTLAGGALALTSGSLFGSDMVGGGSFAFTNKNAGIGNKTVTVGGATVNDGNGGANYVVSYANNTTSTINPASLTLTSSPVSRGYDGTTTATGAALVTNGALIGGDTLGATTVQFDNRNVGSSKTVNITNAVINDGNGGANYSLSFLPDIYSSITPAPLMITTNPVTKVYDGLTNASGLAVATSGTAVFAGDSLSGGSYAYTDRSMGLGNKTVTASGVSVNDGNGGANYSVGYADNTGSSITRRAVSNWTGAAGNNLWSSPSNWDVLPDGSNVLAVSIPSGAGTVALDVGVDLQSISSGSPISQISGGSLRSSALNLVTHGGVSLGGSGNQIAQWTAANSGGGSLTLINGVPVTMGAISNSNGDIIVTNTGAVVSNGPVRASGNVAITALSPLTIGAGGVNADGNVVLTAGNLSVPNASDNLTLNGPIIAGNTVGLYAGNNLAQNAAVVGANGVVAQALGRFSFGPLATTNSPPIAYSAGGLPVSPPPTVLASSLLAPGDIIVTFLDLLQDMVDGGQGESLETNPDGSKEKKRVDGVVAEEEVCR